MSTRTTTTTHTEESLTLSKGPPGRRHAHHWAVSPGDEHDRGVESLCVGEAA
ncbi:MAG: hypothetical protein M0Z95_27470 [Actinomycetota bacterium]|jgi:hypothetical protein|nr:hypothetical protein [Actinomycetota bacterium]